VVRGVHSVLLHRKEVVKSGLFTKPHKLFVGTRKEVVKSEPFLVHNLSVVT
jgi:hypothetical protein